jgi:hypothetical protein
VKLKLIISPWNIITKLHIKKIQNSDFGGKRHGYIFWYSGGVIQTDCLEPETTINSQCYTAVLKTLKQCLRRVQKHKKNILLQHDNIRPHTAMQSIEQFDHTISPHLLYSPRFVLCNLQLFSRNEGGTVRTWIKKQCGVL